MGNRYFVLGAVLASGGILAAGWFLGVQPKLAETAAANAAREAAVDQNALHEAQLKQLEQDYARIDELRATVAELREAVPAHHDYSGFVAELNTIATQTGATLPKVTVGDSTWYTPAPAVAAPEQGPGAPPETPT